jgi:hypothetical protein
MADITFEEILQAVQKLNPQQKALLGKALLAQRLEIPTLEMSPTRESLIAEFEALRAAKAFDNVESLRNKYANPALDALTDEQLAADIHEAATAWEQELDEFFGDEN